MHQVLLQKCIMGYGEMSIWVTKSVECRWDTIGVEEAVLLSFMAFTTALTTLFLVLFVWGWNREDRFNFLFRGMTSLGKWLEPILLWVNGFMPVTAVKKSHNRWITYARKMTVQSYPSFRQRATITNGHFMVPYSCCQNHYNTVW